MIDNLAAVGISLAAGIYYGLIWHNFLDLFWWIR